MKRILSIGFLVLLLSFAVTIVSFGQVRKSKEIPKLVKKAPRTEAFQFAVTVTTDGKQSHYEFVSLKDIDQEKLTETERDLLNTFEEVAFCFNGEKFFVVTG